MRRRTFLRGLGLGAGAALLAPLVSRIASAGEGVPCRFVFVVEGNCFEPITMLGAPARAAIDATTAAPLDTQRWWYRSYRHDAPLMVGGGLETAPALGPLALDAAVAEQAGVVFGLSSRIVGGGHSAMHGVLSSARTISGVPGGQTFDAYLGALPQVRGETPFDAVRLGVSPGNDPLDFGTCAYAEGRGAPLMLNPAAAYDALFGSVGSASGREAFGRKRSLLDFAGADVTRALAAFPGNSRERAKLESYLASVEELTRRHERLVLLEPQLEANRPTAPDANPLFTSPDPLDRFRAHLQLTAAALKGELTHVAVVGCGTGGNFGLTYTSVSPDVGRHDMHHGSARDPELLRRIHEVTRLQVEAIVTHLAGELAATPEAGADGSMLDHTVIVFIGDNGEQHHSTASEFPILLIGGRRLGLATGGRTIVYPGMSSDGHRQVSNVWNTIGHLVGEPLDEFGREGPSRRAPGPLGELMG
ncbi:MAG: DUF1552 domain-containing protein [Sandaracinaceae bacterium]|nr:DUF1552 domain-containing protein [Sandaracinaceae bacterium]